MKVLKNLQESFLFAISALKVNRLRTFLTLFGITIGIFAIISVFTVIDSLERAIRDSLSSLGDDIIYIEKWPWTPPPGEEYAWWEYLKRPQPDLEEYEYLQKNSTHAEALAFTVSSARTASYRNQSIKNITVTGYTHDFYKIRSFNLAAGRYFSPLESEKGRNVAVIGANIADNLFKGISPLNQSIKISGLKTTVIGVFEKEGKNPVGAENSLDEEILVPLHYAKRFIELNSNRVSPSIVIKSRDNVHIQELIYETQRFMRSIRKLKPKEEDNFAINQASMITRSVDAVFGVINLAGWIIGGFSIIVGGFGIANIMFVSVKERTNIIGIQKALGARNYFILSQFLFEAVLLALIGGGIGMLLIFIGSLIASNMIDMKIMLSAGNIILGFFISAIIGVVSGFAPARSAALLNPVDAINTTF